MVTGYSIVGYTLIYVTILLLCTLRLSPFSHYK